MRFKNVAISGDIGTGKTTLSKKLAEKLGWKRVHAGEFFRNWHETHNIPLSDTKEIPPELDMKIDFGFKDQMKNQEDTIFESRLAGWLAKDFKNTFKILCITDFEVAAKRASQRDNLPIEDEKEEMKKRATALKEKFKILYDVDDYLDPKYFNLVLDTTNTSPDQALEIVLRHSNLAGIK